MSFFIGQEYGFIQKATYKYNKTPFVCHILSFKYQKALQYILLRGIKTKGNTITI